MNEDKVESSSGPFIAAPVENLVAAFHSADSMDTVIEELKENAFAPEDLRTFSGQEGIEELDFDGSSNGPIAELLRYLQGIGPDRTYLERYEEYMRDGDCILMVRAPQKDRKQIAADIIRKHSPHRVTYFGKLVIEEI